LQFSLQAAIPETFGYTLVDEWFLGSLMALFELVILNNLAVIWRDREKTRETINTRKDYR
jgi:hypothetical protein